MVGLCAHTRKKNTFSLEIFFQEEAEEGDSSTEDGSGSDSDSDSSSESGDESESELGSSAGPVAPLEGSPELLSRENLSVIRGARADQGQESFTFPSR